MEWLKKLVRPEETEGRKNKVDVIGQKEVIIANLSRLVAFNIKDSGDLHDKKCRGEISSSEQISRGYENIIREAKSLVGLWKGVYFDGKDYSLPSEGEKCCARERRLEGHNVLSNAREAKITNCVVLGHNALSSSISPVVHDSFVMGHNALDGSSIRELEDPSRYKKFIEIEPKLLQGDSKEKLEAICEFSAFLTDGEIQSTREWFEKTRQDIGEDYTSLILQLTRDVERLKKEEEKKEKRNEELLSSLQVLLDNAKDIEKMAAVAHKLDAIIRQMSAFGDTYHVDIKNSVIFGWNALHDAKGGVIEDSIIAGYRPLDRANLRLKNCYVIDEKETRYIEDQTIGNPDAFEKIPLSLNKKLFFDPLLGSIRSKRLWKEQYGEDR